MFHFYGAYNRKSGTRVIEDYTALSSRLSEGGEEVPSHQGETKHEQIQTQAGTISTTLERLMALASIRE